MVIINVLMIVYFRRRSRPYKKPEAGKDQGPQAQTSIEKLNYLTLLLAFINFDLTLSYGPTES